MLTGPQENLFLSGETRFTFLHGQDPLQTLGTTKKWSRHAQGRSSLSINFQRFKLVTRSLPSAGNRLTVGPWCLAGPGLERANKVLL
jgi:hypothetical protein